MTISQMMMLRLILAVCLSSCSQAAWGSPCVARDYGHGSAVCVCNSSYCDTPELTSLQQLEAGVVRHYVTSKAGRRMHVANLSFSDTGEHRNAAGNVTTTLKVSREHQYQNVLGFGGAILDAVAINTYSLSAATADQLIRAYFSEEGIGYTFVRVPIGPTDFSSHYYEYTGDYQNDTNLEHFNLTVEDTSYKVPFLKRAQEVSPKEVKLFGTAWTAPQWMKEIDNATGKSSLKKECHQAYANYYIKFLKAYAKEGIQFWGLTPQNEPGVALILGKVITMGWTPAEMLQYLVGDLCPALAVNGYGDLKMMLIDDNRNNIPEWIKIFKNDSLSACVNGLALHWYTDKTTSVSVLDEAHTEYPDKFMIYSEACPERNAGDPRVVLGNWKDGAQYISSIIQVTNNWVSGWVDLNMAIGLDGGPNWLNETRNDAPVVVNATADEFYKQPTFYAIAHVSRFVPPGSVRVGLQTAGDGLQGVAFLTPDRVTVVVLHNQEESEVKAVLSDPEKGSVILDIPANSIHTLLYK